VSCLLGLTGRTTGEMRNQKRSVAVPANKKRNLASIAVILAQLLNTNSEMEESI